jgi:amino acid adenylation domain-containing protein
VSARSHPDRLAITAPNGTYTYAELMTEAARIAAALAARGVAIGDRVGILMERTREMVAALLGVLGAGATYVPLDPSYPEARLGHMLDDSGARVVVTHHRLERLLGGKASVLDLDSVELPPPANFVPVDPEQAAYVIYTSGSTGKPKGVAVPHRAVLNFLGAMAECPGLGAEDVLLAVTTISFDISVLELYLPLTQGARVVIAGSDEVSDGRRLAARLESEGVTVMQATPATWKLLLASGWEGSPGLKALCGGEALSRSLADELLKRVGELWNMYGPTETTVWSTISRVADSGPILIGRPIANTKLYVLGERQQLLPVGVPGELFIGGQGVALGYFGRPDLTAERFVENPFRSGERLYRTGDLVRYHSDGSLEHLGRLDHQVKVRGFRIELGEVESALRAQPHIKDAVVVARGESLIAYLIADGPRPPSATDLRRGIGQKLPPYMMPGRFMFLEALPRTPNGKVDRRALPDPGEIVRERAHVPPSGAVEEALADVWATLLEIDKVGAEDNFFELGGHSLLAMEAVALVEERLGVPVDPRTLFFKTLRQQAESLTVAR